MGSKKDRTGIRFGNLIAISENGQTEFGEYKWLCKCDCGNMITVRGGSLAYGSTKSCGCLSPKVAKKLHTKHGLSTTKLYKIWSGMKSRCLNVNINCYHNYGGRGIKVCSRWLNSFENFKKDMGERPVGMTIERENVNGNYEPTNCSWKSRTIQSRNKRKSPGKSSIYIGVFWTNTYKKWQARVHIKNKPNHVGFFDDEKNAALARDTYIKERSLKGYLMNFP